MIDHSDLIVPKGLGVLAWDSVTQEKLLALNIECDCLCDYFPKNEDPDTLAKIWSEELAQIQLREKWNVPPALHLKFVFYTLPVFGLYRAFCRVREIKKVSLLSNQLRNPQNYTLANLAWNLIL